MTGVMMQSQQNLSSLFSIAQFTAELVIAVQYRTVHLCELFFIRLHLLSLMWTFGILRALWTVVLQLHLQL
jgi:hypothetical protein